MPPVNPDILRWARETAGLTLEEASKTLRIPESRGVAPADRLSALEAGEAEPTRSMLVNMAKKYRRPLIVFYMERPPREADRGQDFRSLPDTYSDLTNALVDALIRDVQVRQSIIRSSLEDEEEIQTLTFVGSLKISDGVETLVESIKQTIDYDADIFRNQTSPEDAFKYLRAKVEKTGVFVLLIGDLGSYHTAFDLDVFRGIALSDDIAPFIVINDRDSRAAWSFTLIHELSHIWLGQSGISSAFSELEIEQFCNKVASELLLPESELGLLDLGNAVEFEDRKALISDFARVKNVSSSMIAYKLYLQGRIDRSSWLQLNREYRRLWLEARDEKRKMQKGKKGGPSYYVVRKHRLGENLISLVHQMVLGGTLTTLKASRVLGVAPKNVQNLIEPTIREKS